MDYQRFKNNPERRSYKAGLKNRSPSDTLGADRDGDTRGQQLFDQPYISDTIPEREDTDQQSDILSAIPPNLHRPEYSSLEKIFAALVSACLAAAGAAFAWGFIQLYGLNREIAENGRSIKNLEKNIEDVEQERRKQFEVLQKGQERVENALTKRVERLEDNMINSGKNKK